MPKKYLVSRQKRRVFKMKTIFQFRKRRGWVQVILHAMTGGGGGSVDSWKLQHWVHSRVRAAWLGLNKTLTPALSNWAGMAPLGALLREICRIYGLHKYAQLRHVHLINRNIIIIKYHKLEVHCRNNGKQCIYFRLYSPSTKKDLGA